jgi:biotin carboxyl carrier protein
VRFEVEAGGRARIVELRGGQNGSVEVTVDGRRQAADVTRIGQWWSLLLDGRSYEISVVEQSPGELIVSVNGRHVPVSMAAARLAVRLRGRGGVDGQQGPRRIVAPMPGRVVKVLVKTGDAVKARQGLVVVEAMKMENELRSPKDGTVAEVRAAEGTSVEANAVLVVID